MVPARHDLLDDYYAYREQYRRDLAISWLVAHDCIWTEGGQAALGNRISPSQRKHERISRRNAQPWMRSTRNLNVAHCKVLCQSQALAQQIVGEVKRR